MIARYVLDTGALVAAERGKQRATRLFQLAHLGRARLLVPFPVIAEWWRGRTDVRETMLGAVEVMAPAAVAKAAGIALSRLDNIDAALTIDAIVIATAALSDAIVITSDPSDFEGLSAHFPKVTVLST